MILKVIGMMLGWFGDNALGKILGHLENRVNNETERQRITALRDQHLSTMQARVITSGMEHKWFWIPWLIATVPMSLWFGLGMLGTALPGYLPFVAKIPPGLEPWAKAAWDGLFFSGGGVAAATSIARAIRR